MSHNQPMVNRNRCKWVLAHNPYCGKCVGTPLPSKNAGTPTFARPVKPYKCHRDACGAIEHVFNRRGSRPNFEWVPSRIQKFRIAAKRRTEIFVLLGGSGGMLPRKILKIKLLRLLEIAFPTNILKITFFPSSHKLLFQLEIFSNKFHSLWRQKRHNCISGVTEIS